jgi:hypothetical protein
MMYSQQEYDMMRRQTMQIEAEKRTLLRTGLMIVAVLLTISLLLLGYLYRQYSISGSVVSAAESRAAASDSQYQVCAKELSEKKGILDAQSAELAARNKVIEDVLPKVMRKQGSDADVARLAHAIYAQPGHVIALPGVPPDEILRRMRYRTGNATFAYVLIAGLVDSKWLLYSNLVGKSD